MVVAVEKDWRFVFFFFNFLIFFIYSCCGLVVVVVVVVVAVADGRSVCGWFFLVVGYIILL